MAIGTTTLLAITAAAAVAGTAVAATRSRPKAPPLAAPAPELPPIPEPAVAPVADDLAIKAQQRRKSAQVRQRSGRLSTINTAPALGSTVLG